MGKRTDQVNVRLDDRMKRVIADIRRHADPDDIPTASDVVRQALLEKHGRMFGNAKGQRGKQPIQPKE